MDILTAIILVVHYSVQMLSFYLKIWIQEDKLRKNVLQIFPFSFICHNSEHIAIIHHSASYYVVTTSEIGLNTHLFTFWSCYLKMHVGKINGRRAWGKGSLARTQNVNHEVQVFLPINETKEYDTQRFSTG